MTEEMETDLRPIRGGSTLTARVKPRSRKGLRRLGNTLIIGVSAAPIAGRANDQATRVLAEALDVAPGAVTVRSGETSPTKVFEVRGLEPDEVQKRLDALLKP
ncbi:MAG TPA: DUF167 domain-containing protein [Actinomycetota bacterium]|nr:DUF167 domain-containing protein [Actinomycetota bacterium]